jgi:glycosyltransferase involved in cell wall biosynthesis
VKKILFAVTTDLNYDQRMQRICNSLQSAGYGITLIGRHWPVSKPLKPQIYKQHRLRCFFEKGKLFYFEFNIRLFFFLLKSKQDAYGAVDLDTALPVLSKAKISRKPYIFDAHEYFSEMPEVIRRPIIKRIWEFIEQVVIPRASYTYTVSASIAEILARKYGKAFWVIRNLPVRQLPGISPAPAPITPFILYQGAVNEGRGLEELLIAMQQVNMQLVICGEGDLLGALKQQARQLDIAHKVDFRGYILPADLVTITRQAFLGIMLLAETGLSYYYSLSNKFFDYIQAGIPQVFTAFPEYRQINEQYGIGLPTELDPVAIAKTINRLIEDKALYTQLAENCLKAAEELNWEQEEKKLLSLYDTIW